MVLLERDHSRLLLFLVQTLKETKRQQVIMFNFKNNVVRKRLLKRFVYSVDENSKEN